MSTQQASTEQKSISIGGMGCAGCANTIQEVLEGLNGVTETTVDLENNTVAVIYDPEAVSLDDFKEAIEEAGYDFLAIG